MKGKSVFLGGPIQYAMSLDGNFDEKIKYTIKQLINMFECKGYKVYSAHVAERFGELTQDLKCDQVCLRDFNWMKHCDIYIAFLPKDESGSYVRSDGTYVEIGWASQLGKPIILVGEVLMCSQLSMLVRGLGSITSFEYLDIDEIVNTPEKIISVIQYLLTQDKSVAEV